MVKVETQQGQFINQIFTESVGIDRNVVFIHIEAITCLYDCSCISGVVKQKLF